MSLSKLNKTQKEAKMAAAAARAADAVTDDATPAANANTPIIPHHFYTISMKSKDGEWKYNGVVLQQVGFVKLLLRLGYRRFNKNDGTFCIVNRHENILEEVSIQDLRNEVFRFIQRIPADADGKVIDPETGEATLLPLEDLVEKYVRSMSTLLSEEKLSLLLNEGEQYELLKDTKDTAFFFFQNGFVQVSRDGIKLRPYAELPGSIWKDQILPRNYVPLSDEEVESGMFYRFCCNVSGNRPKEGEPANTIKGTNPERFNSLMTIAGYNLHNFFQTSLKTTILLDARTSEDPDGRSGKSLFCKALQYVLTADIQNSPICVTIDGKTFDPDNRFKYDQLIHNTRLVVFDDIKRGLQLEEFFNAILDGFLVERKGSVRKERVYTKALFTLNYTMKVKGGSARDRVVEFEFADYYSSEFKPEQEFGCWFFRDWNEQEWARFDCFLMQCVNAYFTYGIVKASTINLDARKLRDQTSQEFIAFMEESPLEHEKLYDKKQLWAQLVDAQNQDANDQRFDFFKKSRTLTSWLKDWCELRPEVAGYRQTRSNGKDFFQIFYNAPVQPIYNDERAKFFPGKCDNCFPDDTDTSTPTADSGEKLPF